MEIATTMERHVRERITKAIVEIAERPDRAAESVRRLADRSDGRDPARKIDQLQNELAWLFPKPRRRPPDQRRHRLDERRARSQAAGANVRLSTKKPPRFGEEKSL